MKNKTYSHPVSCPYCHSVLIGIGYEASMFACHTKISFAQQKPHAKRTLKCIAIEHARTKAA